MERPASPRKITAKLKGKPAQIGRLSTVMTIIFNVLAVDANGLVRRRYLMPGRIHPLHRHQTAVTAIVAAVVMVQPFSHVQCFF